MSVNAEKPRSNHSGTQSLFKNPILEALSRTHIAVPISIYLISSAGLGWYAFTHTALQKGMIGGLLVSGLIVFTLVEYATHRGIFHMEPTTTLKSRLQYIFHGIHHDFPKDQTRLAMPPALAILIGLALFSITFMGLGEAAYAFFPGFLSGYAGYLFVHFIVHAYKPPRNVFKWLWINHAIHHYKNDTLNYGVSSPLWDYIFKTYSSKG